MAITGSGLLTLSTLQSEFGGANPIGLSEYYRNSGYVTDNNTNVPANGTISISNFYNTVKQFAFTISTNYSTPQSLASLASNAGWNGSDYLLVTNNAILSSNTTGSPALSVTGAFPNGVRLNNYGMIIGMGGRGGDYENNGSPGGNALGRTTGLTLANYGVLAGGGGGGGAGVTWGWNGFIRSMAGSGGASGLTAAVGGNNPAGGAGGTAYPSRDLNGDGIYETYGESFNWGWGGRASSPGGRGGSWGATGDRGGTVDGNYNYSGYYGGAGGAAVSGAGYINWIATGTRYGAVVG